MPRRLFAIALTAWLAVVSAGAALVGGLWGFGLKCDDSCSTAPGWREDAGAWQWNALGTLPLVGLVTSALVVGAVAAGRRSAAWLALACWAAVGVGFLLLLDGSGLTSHVERGWAGLAASSLAGGAGILLAARARSPR